MFTSLTTAKVKQTSLEPRASAEGRAGNAEMLNQKRRLPVAKTYSVCVCVCVRALLVCFCQRVVSTEIRPRLPAAPPSCRLVRGGREGGAGGGEDDRQQAHRSLFNPSTAVWQKKKTPATRADELSYCKCAMWSGEIKGGGRQRESVNVRHFVLSCLWGRITIRRCR